MPTPTQIIDGSGTKNKARVSPIGQLVTAPFAYDEVANANMSSANTAYNLFKPKSGQQFVIKTILITTKKDVTTDEIIDIYESSSLTSTTISKSILQVELLKSTDRDLVGLNLLITDGKFVNAKADDATTLVTIMGYYIPKL